MSNNGIKTSKAATATYERLLLIYREKPDFPGSAVINNEILTLLYVNSKVSSPKPHAPSVRLKMS